MGSLSRWLTRNQPRRQQHDSGTTPIDSSWRACFVRRTDSCITRACRVDCYQNFDCNLDTGYITVEQQSRTIALLRNGAQTRVSRFLFFFFCTRKRISIALEFRVGERIHTSTSNLYGSSYQKNKHFCNFIQVVYNVNSFLVRVSCHVGRSVGRLVGWSVGRSVDQPTDGLNWPMAFNNYLGSFVTSTNRPQLDNKVWLTKARKMEEILI